MVSEEIWPSRRITQVKKAPSVGHGVRPPTEIAEPNLRVSVADMLAAQRAEQEVSAPSPGAVLAPASANNDESVAASDSGVLAEVKVDSIRVSPFSLA